MRAVERLFERVPGLRARVAWTPLTVDGPTPLRGVDGIIVKDDGATAPDGLYGGNKVRKLEFLLAEARRRGGPFVTTGATGSHHALASAVHAGRLGLDVEVVRFAQPPIDDPASQAHVDEMAAALDARPNVTVIEVGADWRYLPALAARRLHHGGRALVAGPGGSTPLGTLGYVAAALELAADLAAVELPEPDAVVVPASSSGTVAGLSLGLSLAGWRHAEVHAVRVADVALTNVARIRWLRSRTARLLAEHAPPAPTPIRLDDAWLGEGYGVPTSAGRAATAHAAAHGLSLDPTYTAKAWAATLALTAAGERVVHLHTLSPP